MELTLQGVQLSLLAERAIWWKQEKTLIVADLHWGKAGHFRKHGIAIPAQSQTKDEQRLAQLLQQTGAERLVIAGDLFHSHHNAQVEMFRHFRQHHRTLQMELVIGNHDILEDQVYDDLQLTFHKECLDIAPFCIAHDFIASSHFVIHGHVHPALRIKSPGYNQPALRLCCFAQDDKRMILPAFGKFTGTHLLNPTLFQQLYLIADDKVIAWK